MINALKLYKEKQERIIKQTSDAYNIQDFIFTKTERQTGYPFVIKMVQLRMARLLAIASLNPELTPHSLRHTHTSLLADAGVALEQIMDRLDDQITKSVYLHLTKEMKKEAHQKFSQLLRSLR
ncbi:tyrosine-type recombinase/integrase [Psychrobacillus sp. L4]|uniref:tyrosine-type recombinase/integrase n=1 Tax=Psychrobacillus sp. L4 TaxID=3236892 RepID=UPI0036F34AA2